MGKGGLNYKIPTFKGRIVKCHLRSGDDIQLASPSGGDGDERGCLQAQGLGGLHQEADWVLAAGHSLKQMISER